MKFKFIISVLFIPLFSHGQGCVIIRNIAGFGQFAQLGYNQSDKKWMMNLGNRYFRSIQPFKDSQAIPINPDPSKQNINYNYTFDLSLIRLLGNGWALGIDLPVSSNTIVTRVEHLSGDRHSTHAFGLGDIRITGYKWLRKQEASNKWNVQAGLGLKLPTGDYRYQDYFYNDPTNKMAGQLEPVDPSIQLGDGGTGITLELNGYYLLNTSFSFYGNIFYLINPRDQNGVSTLKGHPADSANNGLNGAYADEATLTVSSAPDNYTVRLGSNFTYKKLVVSAGVRYEGIPRYDLLGENHGLRRVGTVSSVELGLQYKMKTGFLYTFVPIAYRRVLRQSVPDQIQSELQGTYQTTPGRIPAYTFIIGYAFLF